MKGISAVLAVVLIVVITVAIIGLAYGWATGLFGITTEASEEQVGGVTGALQKSVQIVAARCDGEIYFTIKSTGSKDILASELTAFANDELIDDANNLYWIAPVTGDETAGFQDLSSGTTSNEYVIYHPTNSYTGPVTLMIDAPAGAVEKDVVCP